jgi:light-regulated signal transduction histidine kinase (bacteriophytochrome)
MRQIILDLLEFSRVGRQEIAGEKIDLNKLMDETIAIHGKVIEERDAKIHVELLPTVFSQKAPLLQVFQNLIGNALKYTDKDVKPEISVTVSETKNDWTIALRDNGIGIDAEYFEKIFIIFQRLHAKDEYEGTGMGLAIVKKIIENLGGKIWVESKEGHGSTFFFTIFKAEKI